MIDIRHLYQEKAARLEGLYVEKLFVDQLVKPSFGVEFSSGWWFVKAERNYKIIKLCLNGPELNEIDYELAELFLGSDEVVRLSVAFFDETAGVFKYCAVSNADELREESFAEDKIKVLPVGKPAGVNEEDPEQLERTRIAVERLAEAGYVRDVARERYFASYILGEKYAWDLDCYVKHKGKILAFEVKQKFPIPHSASFGINKGLGRLFTFHQRLGIACYHIVLTKPVWNKDFSAIKLLEDEAFGRLARWIGAEVKATYFDGKAFTSPDHTSLYRNSTLTYYELPVKDFYFIKSYHDTYHQQCLLSFLEGHSLKLRGINDIPVVKAQEGNH